MQIVFHTDLCHLCYFDSENMYQICCWGDVDNGETDNNGSGLKPRTAGCSLLGSNEHVSKTDLQELSSMAINFARGPNLADDPAHFVDSRFNDSQLLAWAVLQPTPISILSSSNSIVEAR